MSEKKLLMLDGSIIKTIVNRNIAKSQDTRLSGERSKIAIDWFAKNNYEVVAIENELEIGDSREALNNCVKEQAHALKILPVLTAIFFCPDPNGLVCYRVTLDDDREKTVVDRYEKKRGDYLFRKPDRGMFDLATKLSGTKESGHRDWSSISSPRPSEITTSESAEKINPLYITEDDLDEDEEYEDEYIISWLFRKHMPVHYWHRYYGGECIMVDGKLTAQPRY